MLNNIRIRGFLLPFISAGTGFNPVPLVIFSAIMAGSVALGMR